MLYGRYWMSGGLHCDQLVPRQQTVPMAGNPHHTAMTTTQNHPGTHHTELTVEKDTRRKGGGG